MTKSELLVLYFNFFWAKWPGLFLAATGWGFGW